jgi:hypothetical protein
MNRLAGSIMGLYALGGEHINQDLFKALQGYSVSEEAKKRHNERVESVLKFEKPEFIPVSADIRWWIVEKWHDGTLQKELENCDLERVLLSVAYAIGNQPQKISPIPEIQVEEKWSGKPVVYVNGGYPGTKREITVNTPIGSLRASEEYASRSFGITEYPVKTIEDLKVVRYIYEQTSKYGPGEVSGCAPMVPIQILLIHLAGVENTVYLMDDYKEEIEEFLFFLEEIFKPVFTAFAKERKVVFSVENFSSDISGGYFDSYIAPVLHQRSKIAAEYGAVIGVHHDGKLAPMVGKLKECGVGYINGITAAPSGDLEPEDIRKVVGEGVVLVDIFPQSIFMSDYNEEDFVAYVKRVAEFYKNDHGIIFGIGDMLPCVGEIKRFEMMIKMVEEITRN